jgi:glycosyltransferase involved in cell wall biosynthesis
VLTDRRTPAPALTVVIPSRNVETTLKAQLDALLTQHWRLPFEVLVVDNGSTDGTRDLVVKVAAVDRRVRLVDASERAGISYARNTGVRQALSDCVAICDGDDIVAPGWVAAMGEALLEHDFATGPLELRSLNPPWVAESRGLRAEDTAPSFFGVLPYAHGCNLGVRRSAWAAVGGFDEDVEGAEDVEFAVRLARTGVRPVFTSATVHYRYRTRGRDLYRQGRAYGRCRPLIRRRLRENGLPRPSPISGWRSWIWLLRSLALIRTTEGRAQWLWVLGNRIGHVQGSVKHRTVLL